MNNIYKVIWSKAKNCYVVVSEIARSHTKSASGSEKMGEVARRALLALGAACAIACGGFVNVGAVEYEHVDVQTTGTSTATVYTKNGTESYVDHALTHFDTKTQVDDKIKALKTGDVATNKDNITALQTTTTDHGQKITANTTQIANNTAAIAKKIDTETAEAKLALKANAADVYTKADVNTELAKKADVTALDGKADKSYVDTAVAGAVTTAGTNVDAKLAAYATTAEVDGKIADEVNARNNAITTTIEQERHDRDAAIDNAINGEVTERNQAIHDAIELEKTNRDAAITNAKLELQGKITGEETERKEADTAFNNRLTTAEGKIGANETAIGELKAKDTALEGKINAEKTEREAKDNAILGRIGKVADDGNYIKNSNTNSVSKNLKALDAQAKINADAIAAETVARAAKDTELEGKITKSSQDITNLQGDVTTAQGDITNLKAKDTELEGKIQTNANNIQANKDAIDATNKRTSGIEYDNVRDETTIENNVVVDSIGNVTAKGQLTAYDGVYTGTGDITTKGDVNAGSLNVENASHLKGDVTMDKGLTVTSGDTTLKGTKVDGKLTVTDDADLKNTKVDGTLITTGKATFQEAVEMDKGLTVTGDTKLKATTVDGKLTAGDADLKNTQVNGKLGVTGETMLNDKLTAKGEATFEKNVTVEKDLTVNGKLNVGEIYMEHNKLESTGKQHNSATSITADGISNLAKVTEHGNTTESQFTHNEKGSFNYAKDGNTTDWKESTSNVTADGVKTEAKDSKGNRTNTSQTAEGIKGYATDKDGYKTYTKVTAKENSFQVQDKDGKNKNHQVNTLDKSVTEITNADGKTTKTEQTALDITNTAKDGTITNDAKDIVNNASGNMTNTVGGDLTTTVSGNELHEVTGTKTENVTGKVTENYGNGQETNVTGDQNIYVTGNQTTTVTGDISNKAENITNEANTKLTDKVGDNTRVLDSEGITDTVPGADGKGSTFKQRIDAIMGNVKTDAGESEVTQKGDEITSVVGKGEATNSRVTQKKGSLEAGVTDGTNTNASYDVADASAKVLSGGTKVNKLQDNLDSSEKTITNGTYTTSKLQTALDITNTAKDGTITNDAKNIVNNASGDMTNTVGGKLTTTVTGQATENFKGGLDTNVTGTENHTVTGDQNIHVTGNQTTTVTGDISNKAENITNEANTKLTDKVGDNTRVLDSEGITDTVPGADGKGSTFKQRIDAIMGNVKTDAGESEVTQKGDEITSVVGKGEATNSRVTQKKGSLEAGVTDGTNTNASYDVADASAKVLSGGTKVNKLQDNLDSSEKTITNGTYTTSKLQTALDITNTAKDGTITNDAKNIVNNASGDMTNTVGGKLTTTVTGQATENFKGGLDTNVTGTENHTVTGDQNIHVTGNQTTTVTGDISNKAENITNEANTKLTDKVGDNTRVLDSEGITDTVPGADGKGSTFKQRIDAIMGNVKTDAGESEVTQKGDEITSVVGKGEATNSRVTQKKGSLEAGVTDGTNTNASYDVADASAKVLSGGTKVNKLQDNLDSSEKTITNGTYTTSKLQTALDITNTAKYGTITNDAKNIVNNASGNMTNTVGGDLTTTVSGNELHEVTGTKTENVTGKVTENYGNGQETNVTGDQNIHVTGDQTTTISGTQTTTARDINRNASSSMVDKVDNAYGTNTETKEAGKTTTDVSIKGTGETGLYIRGANESRDYLIKGTLKNSETKTAEATSTEITDGNGKTSSTIQDVTQISGSVTDGTNTSVSNVKANSIDSAVTDGSSISTINQKKNRITSQVTDGTTITKTEQDTKNITNTAKDGTITNDAKDIVNNASGNMTNTVGGDLTTTVSGNELHEVTGKQTNKIDGDQENTIGGNQTTTVTGDISNKAENITNEANTKLTDKVGENTRVLDSEGITDTVGGSTFKQRIDKIMMESKDVSIKAEETLTNEAKVITNKASEVINNEAVNINNTATGIITSKASEIKNQADKLISNKVGENTWENMENGKITTSIKDGAKQNLTQSDAAGTTQSTVDGGKSTVTIQNADGLVDAVTDGTNTSVQNQTASAIAAAVKDGAGNENASVANATTSVNTIKSGSKANTVISTADGTSFINSEAAAPVGDGTEVKTTIKGNTITTGKVTMDYAEVMKDLGVRGNANITGKTTTGSLEVTGTSTLKGDVTMESNATVKKDFTVEGNTNLKNAKVDGTLDVTQKATFGDSVSIAKDLSVGGNATIKGDVTASSYKVGDKTYISAAGINANDQKITNVADGSISEGSKDAVNGGQLYTVKNDLEGKVNKVGANAAAMANLHPMEFDPDSKWNIAAAIGNYGSETAAALGAFYRPNDDVMVNLSTAFGTGENMVGGGVSVRLGKSGNKLSREESNALKDQVNDLTARMDALLSVLNPNMSKDFPDVPENHWAYEAVSRLAGNDIVQGYPDGEFHGERTMTRYEMAEIIYNALSRGAEAEKELVEEFKPELQAMAASEKATAERAEG